MGVTVASGQVLGQLGSQPQGFGATGVLGHCSALESQANALSHQHVL